MICKRCGSQMFNNASSCPFCGAVIGAENETDPNQNLIPDLDSLTALDGGMPSLSVDPLPASTVQTPAQAPAAPVDPVPQSTAPQNPFPQSTAPQNPFGQDPVPQNPFPQSAAPQNPFGQDPVPQNPFGQSAAPQNPFPQSAAPQNPFPQSAAPQNPFPQSTAPQNPFGQDPVPQNPFPQNAAEQNPLPPLSGMKSGGSESFVPLPGLSGGGTAVKSNFLGGMSMRLAAKVLIVLAILAFSLPFVTVSCSMGEYGDQVIATYSGFQLMTGDLGDEAEDPAKEMNDTLNGMFGEDFFQSYADEDDDEDDDVFYEYQDSDDMLSLFGNVQKEENNPAADAESEMMQENQGKLNGFLIGSLLCGLLAFGLLFIKDKKLEIFSMLGCVLAAMLTLISSLTFQSFYHVTDNPDMAEYIVVKTRYGVFVVVVLFILAALAALKESIDINSSRDY